MHVIGKKYVYITFSFALLLILVLLYQSTSLSLNVLPEDEILEKISFPKIDKLFDLTLKYFIKPNKCTDGLVVILVTSYFSNVEVRSAQRRAFSADELTNLNVQRVFLLGVNDKDPFLSQAAVEDEARKFQDILQGNFEEAYRNLTYKHLMGLKWASETCKNTTYIVKMDDDIVVNMLEFLKFLQQFKYQENYLLAGYILHGMIPIREKANKWFVSHEEYTENTYPTFLSGWLYITNQQTAVKLVALHKSKKYFWIDDLFITGTLAAMLKIQHLDIGKYFTVHSEFLKCCIHDVSIHNFDCEILIGPNGGENNLFYEFNTAVRKCVNGVCQKRLKSLNETCVAERKINLGRGNSSIQSFKIA